VPGRFALPLATALALGAPLAAAQRPDTAAVAIPPVTVTATRGTLPPDSLPWSWSVVPAERIGRARPTWGLDEALGTVPGVFVANRANFSLDQRLAVRGFGSRSAFAVRGVKVLIDGVPQTLPDGQGQLTNLELGGVERIEVIRGAAAALYGNAAGGVVSITTPPLTPRATQELRMTAGAFDRSWARSWHKWQLAATVPVGGGAARLTASRLRYAGERDHSAADLRSVGARLALPLGAAWTVTVAADVGDQPLAQNPGALTLPELQADPDSAAPLNLTQRAGKDVVQTQAAVTARRRFAHGGQLTVTAFGLTRDLDNPQTFAWITVDRAASGARATWSGPVTPRHHLTAGLDWQLQRDGRVNYGNASGVRDTTRLLDQDERVSEVGPFAQVTLGVARDVAVTAGARFDVVRFRVADRLVSGSNPDDSGERTMSAASGSFGVTWTATPRAMWYANVATAFETPTTTELANTPSGAGGFNDSLGPQRARMAEAGLRWTAGRARASLAAFTADVRDELVSFEVPGAPQRRFFRNAGRAAHAGVEVALDVHATPWLDVAAAWTAARYRYVDFAVTTPTDTFSLDGRPLPGLPAQRLHVVLEARPGARLPWVDLEVVSTGSVLVDDTLDTRAARWTVVNVRAGWEGSLGAWRIRPFAAVQNVLDAQYVGSVVTNAARGRYYEPAPGRNAYVGVELRWR
jgi:iron complex outermembrane receptor protein